MKLFLLHHSLLCICIVQYFMAFLVHKKTTNVWSSAKTAQWFFSTHTKCFYLIILSVSKIQHLRVVADLGLIYAESRGKRDAFFLSPVLFSKVIYFHTFLTHYSAHCCMHMALSLWTTQGTVDYHNSWAGVTYFYSGQCFFSWAAHKTAIIGALLKLPKLHCPPPVTKLLE